MQINVIGAPRLPTLTIASTDRPRRYDPGGIAPTANSGVATSTSSLRSPWTMLAAGWPTAHGTIRRGPAPRVSTSSTSSPVGMVFPVATTRPRPPTTKSTHIPGISLKATPIPTVPSAASGPRPCPTESRRRPLPMSPGALMSKKRDCGSVKTKQRGRTTC